MAMLYGIQHGHIWNFFSYRTLIANRLRYCFFVIAFRPIFSLLQKLLDLLRPGKSQPVSSHQRLPALSYRSSVLPLNQIWGHSFTRIFAVVSVPVDPDGAKKERMH